MFTLGGHGRAELGGSAVRWVWIWMTRLAISSCPGGARVGNSAWMSRTTTARVRLMSSLANWHRS